MSRTTQNRQRRIQYLDSNQEFINEDELGNHNKRINEDGLENYSDRINEDGLGNYSDRINEDELGNHRERIKEDELGNLRERIKEFMKNSDNYNFDNFCFEELSENSKEKRINFYEKYNYEDIYCFFILDSLNKYLQKIHELGTKTGMFCGLENVQNKNFQSFTNFFKETTYRLVNEISEFKLEIERYVNNRIKSFAQRNELEEVMRNIPGTNLLEVESYSSTGRTDLFRKELQFLEAFKIIFNNFAQNIYNVWKITTKPLIKSSDILEKLMNIHQKMIKTLILIINEFETHFNNLNLQDLSSGQEQYYFDSKSTLKTISYIVNWRDWKKNNGTQKYPHAHQLYLFFQSHREIKDRKCGDKHYEGEIMYGEKNGFGICIWNEKKAKEKQWQKHEGIWRGNYCNGSGVRYFENGDIHIGEFKEGERNGFGICSFSNRSRYEGEWNNDKPNGFGIFYNSSKKKRGKKPRCGIFINFVRKKREKKQIGIWKDGRFIEK